MRSPRSTDWLDQEGGGSVQRRRLSGQDTLGAVRLGLEFRPLKNGGVPLDQRRDWTGVRDGMAEKIPYGVSDRSVVSIDEQRPVHLVNL